MVRLSERPTSRISTSSRSSPTEDEPEDARRNGEEQESVNRATQHVERGAERPHHDEQDGKRPEEIQHGPVRFRRRGSRASSILRAPASRRTSLVEIGRCCKSIPTGRDSGRLRSSCHR